MSSFILMLFLLLVVVAIWLLAIVFFAMQMRYSFKPNTIVFIPTVSSKVTCQVDRIIDQYITQKGKQTEDYYFLEPGCGLANVSHHMGQKYNFKKIIGIELDWLTWQAARVYNWLRRGSMDLHRQNIFEYDWPSQPAVMYSFLSSEILTEMYKRGFLQDKLVISTVFSIKEVESTEKIELPSKFYHSLYVYDFRKA
jgi:hypothetical protein